MNLNELPALVERLAVANERMLALYEAEFNRRREMEPELLEMRQREDEYTRQRMEMDRAAVSRAIERYEWEKKARAMPNTFGETLQKVADILNTDVFEVWRKIEPDVLAALSRLAIRETLHDEDGG